MSCRALELCDQLLPAVQTVFPQAKVDLMPAMALDAIHDLEVSVTPEGLVSTYQTRGAVDTEVTAGIAAVQHVVEPAAIRALLNQMELLFDAIKFLNLPIGVVTAFRNQPIYDLDLLRSDRVFLSVIDVTVTARKG